MEDFSGRVAFVTGGASGIGLALGATFLKAGMNLVVADVDQAHLDEARLGLKWAGQRAHFMSLDVTDRAAMRSAARETEVRFGKVHVLCNNAGVVAATPIEDAGYAEWDRVMGVNLGGLINGLVEFLPGMKSHGEGGHIVNTASMAALSPSPSRSGIYSAAKFAVRGVTEALRLSVVDWDIGVSLLCPGPVDTRILQSRPKIADSENPLQSLTGAMGPAEVGRRVLQGIRNNDAFIFTHSGWHREIAGIFDEILTALPEGPEPDDPFYVGRRDAIAQRKARARKLGGG